MQNGPSGVGLFSTSLPTLSFSLLSAIHVCSSLTGHAWGKAIRSSMLYLVYYFLDIHDLAFIICGRYESPVMRSTLGLRDIRTPHALISNYHPI